MDNTLGDKVNCDNCGSHYPRRGSDDRFTGRADEIILTDGGIKGYYVATDLAIGIHNLKTSDRIVIEVTVKCTLVKISILIINGCFFKKIDVYATKVTEYYRATKAVKLTRRGVNRREDNPAIGGNENDIES